MAIASGARSVEAEIRATIETIKGSHMFEPWFGWPIAVFAGIPDVAATAAVIKASLLLALPDVLDPNSLQITTSIDDTAMLQVGLGYQILTEATPRTLEVSFRAPLAGG
ncbi:MAG TPA: hypothetical protein VI756_09095 [Blastocatellia bacterium]